MTNHKGLKIYIFVHCISLIFPFNRNKDFKMPTPKDQVLYDKIKKDVYLKYPKHSAYRSGMLVKAYKEAYLKKYKSNDAYLGSKNPNQGLQRWFSEVWLNQRGQVGYQKKGDIYRPLFRVTKDTPTTYSELSRSQIEKAMKEKKTKGRVKRYV